MIIFDISQSPNDTQSNDDYLIYKFYSDDGWVSSKDTDFREFMDGINFPKDMHYRIDEDDNILLDIPDDKMDIFIFFKDNHKDDKDRYLTTNPLKIVFESINFMNNPNDDDPNNIIIKAVRNKKTPYINHFKRIISAEDRSPAHIYLYF